jgi:hypothetical protein
MWGESHTTNPTKVNNMNTNTTVDTKANKEAESVSTALTLDWEGMTEQDLRDLAQQALIVKLQSGWRKNGIPTEATVKVVDHKVGTRAPRGPVNIAAAVSKMSDAEKAELRKLLGA